MMGRLSVRIAFAFVALFSYFFLRSSPLFTRFHLFYSTQAWDLESERLQWDEVNCGGTEAESGVLVS